MTEIDRKLDRLRKLVRSYGSAAVAFSGGMDSTLVTKIARDELAETVAVTVDSPMYPRSELAKARDVAKRIGIEHVVIKTDPLKESHFTANPPDRCYLCKLDDLRQIRGLAQERGLDHVLDGSNRDDRNDYRPGLRAKEEMRVKSPLEEAGLTKADVKAISRKLRLPTASKSPSPCLASRIPYGETITIEKLRMVEEAEEFLRAKGFDDVRVRIHGQSARIEVASKDIPRLANPGTRISVTRKLKSLGFTYVSLDMEGYRMGSMNEVLRR